MPLKPRFLTLANVVSTNGGFPQSVSCGASIVFPGFHPGCSEATKEAADMGSNIPLHMALAKDPSANATTTPKSAYFRIEGTVATRVRNAGRYVQPRGVRLGLR
jgi:hypothetical protein